MNGEYCTIVVYLSDALRSFKMKSLLDFCLLLWITSIEEEWKLKKKNEEDYQIP